MKNLTKVPFGRNDESGALGFDGNGALRKDFKGYFAAILSFLSLTSVFKLFLPHNHYFSNGSKFSLFNELLRI